MDSDNEWANWRGRVVRRQHHTYCEHDKGKCYPKTVLIDYVIVGGNAASALRKYCCPGLTKKEKDHLLVLIPITRDTDEDSFELVEERDVLTSWTNLAR